MGGWVALAAVVSAFDTWARRRGTPTMSAAYREAYTAHPVVMAAATCYLTCHLTGYLPRRLDVLCTFR